MLRACLTNKSPLLSHCWDESKAVRRITENNHALLAKQKEKYGTGLVERSLITKSPATLTAGIKERPRPEADTIAGWVSFTDRRKTPHKTQLPNERVATEWCCATKKRVFSHHIKSFLAAWQRMFHTLTGLFPFQQPCSLSQNCRRYCRGFFSPSDPSVWEFSIISSVPYLPLLPHFCLEVLICSISPLFPKLILQWFFF